MSLDYQEQIDQIDYHPNFNSITKYIFVNIPTADEVLIILDK